VQVGCASTGLWACFVPLRDLSFLQQVKIDRKNIEQIWPDNPDFSGVYPFVMIDQNTTQGRFFSPPKYGIVEDPVTGTACGALGAFLMAQGHLPENGELTARQGFEMGRGGQVRVRRSANGKILIRGQAVAVLRGEITTG
jgi:PhzF family phenazine biosynthesis protein